MSKFNLNNITLAEINERMAENARLNTTIDTLNTTIQKLNKENKDLKKEMKKIQDEHKAREQDMKQKFMQLHSEQKKVNNELDKYEAVPEFKGILNIYSELLAFRNTIDNIFKNDQVFIEKKKMDKRIDELRQSNSELELQLKKQGKKVKGKVRANELQQAEMELNKMKEESKVRYITSKGKIADITGKMKNSTTKLSGTITNALAEVQKHLDTYKNDIADIKKGAEAFPEKAVYEKIVNILLEQQNTLMKEMLNNAHSSKVPSSPSSNDYEGSQYDSGSDIDEDDVCSEQGDTKSYKIIMHNVNEQWMDSLEDLQKVKAILKTFTNIPTDNIDIERMGKITPGKKRPIVLRLTAFSLVQVILKNKHRLKNTCYSDIRICSYKNKNKPGNRSRGNKS